jgi:hypothetical protein
MKTFKEYINEGLTDKMKPKSEEEIKQKLASIPFTQRIETIKSKKIK